MCLKMFILQNKDEHVNHKSDFINMKFYFPFQHRIVYEGLVYPQTAVYLHFSVITDMMNKHV